MQQRMKIYISLILNLRKMCTKFLLLTFLIALLILSINFLSLETIFSKVISKFPKNQFLFIYLTLS